MLHLSILLNKKKKFNLNLDLFTKLKNLGYLQTAEVFQHEIYIRMINIIRIMPYYIIYVEVFRLSIHKRYFILWHIYDFRGSLPQSVTLQVKNNFHSIL